MPPDVPALAACLQEECLFIATHSKGVVDGDACSFKPEVVVASPGRVIHLLGSGLAVVVTQSGTTAATSKEPEVRSPVSTVSRMAVIDVGGAPPHGLTNPSVKAHPGVVVNVDVVDRLFDESLNRVREVILAVVYRHKGILRRRGGIGLILLSPPQCDAGTGPDSGFEVFLGDAVCHCEAAMDGVMCEMTQLVITVIDGYTLPLGADSGA